MKRKPLFLVLFIITLLLPSKTFAEDKSGTLSKEPEISVRAFVDKSNITIGEKIKYTLEVDSNKSIDIEFPFVDSNLGGFAIRDFGEDNKRRIGGKRIRQRRWYILDSYTAGSYVIPPQEIKATLPNGNVRSLKSSQVFVEVQSVMENSSEQGLRDIKSVVAIFSNNLFFLYILAITLLLLTAVSFWIYYRRKNAVVKKVPPLPAHEVALAELKRIEVMNLIKKNRIKEYYYLVSNCLRKYLERRFFLKAPEQTTEEFLEFATNSNSLPQEYISLLKKYLSHCDLVKYAKLEPGEQRSKELIDTTRQFIKKTKA